MQLIQPSRTGTTTRWRLSAPEVCKPERPAFDAPPLSEVTALVWIYRLATYLTLGLNCLLCIEYSARTCAKLLQFRG